MIRRQALHLAVLTGMVGSAGCGGEGGGPPGSVREFPAGGGEARVDAGGWAPLVGESGLPSGWWAATGMYGHRVVSLIPAATGIVAALGAQGSLVGVGEGDPEPAARGVESVGSILKPSWERVVALEPTLVVVWSAVDAAPLRRSLPDSVVVLRETIETVADLERVTLRLGELLGRSGRAEALVEGLRGDETGLPTCAGEKGGPTAAWIVSVDPIVVAGPSSWPAGVLSAAGARPVPPDVTVPWPTLSSEALAALAPEVLVTAGIGKSGRGRLQRLLPGAALVPIDGDRFHVPTLEFASRAAALSALLAHEAPTPLCTDPAATVPP